MKANSIKGSDFKKGYDTAPSTKKEDLLNRWGFAREVYTIASRTPLEWSVRIGIYGSWGEGKTAILKFVNTIARENNQIVVWFNPWEYATPEEMWESFVLLILNKLNEAGVNVKMPTRLWLRTSISIKKFFRRPVDTLSSLAQLDSYASAGLPILKSFLRFNKKLLNKLETFLSDKRIIVLIDDLDRSNPVLVPQLLFAVKEILDLPSMVFVLAFDPEIVKKILYSNNNDEGKDFLDKIIDFPKRLPKLNDEDLLRLLKVESSKRLPFLDFNYIQQVYPHLDKNPRKLKQWLRLFIGLEYELKRYSKDEINWTVFLLVNIVKINYPHIFTQIFSSKEIWDDVLMQHLFGRDQDGVDKVPIYLQKIIAISQEHQLHENEKTKLISIIEEIAKLHLPHTTETFLSYAHLTERPTVITQKEFNRILNEYENSISNNKNDPPLKILFKRSDYVEFNILLTSFINDSSYEESEILQAFLQKAIDYWNWSLGQASDAVPGEKTKSHTKDAVLSLNLIEKICFDKNGFVGTNSFLDASHFKSIYEIATKWIHFTMPQDVYGPIREKEKQLLIRICNEASTNLIDLLFFLKPWNIFRHGVYDQPAEKTLAEELSLILEKRISAQLLEMIKIDNWVNSIFVQDSHLVEHYILLRKTSYLWSSDLRQNFLELLNNEDSQNVLSNNMNQFLSLIDAAVLSKERINALISFENSIVSDKELIIEIWKSAFREEINPRMFKSVEELRNELKSKCDIDVPMPSWWERIKQLVEDKAKVKN